MPDTSRPRLHIARADLPTDPLPLDVPKRPEPALAVVCLMVVILAAIVAWAATL